MKAIFYIIAYVIPATIIWGLLGVVLWPLDNIPLLVSLVAWIYTLVFGLLEILGIPFRVPGLRWQVPSSWIKGHPSQVQTIVWGATLGPGLLTVNPYAGMWLLPFLVALNHGLFASIIIAIAIGIAHGSARAVGILSNRRHMDTGCGHLLIMAAQLRWQYIDGLALLLATGGLAAYVISLLGIHL